MDESWKQAVSDLLVSYEQLGGLNRSDTRDMPSKHAVGVICEDLLRLLFPCFHDEDAVRKESFLDMTTERLATVVHNLQTEVRKSGRSGDPLRPTGRTRPILLKFVKDMPAVRQLLHTDVLTACEGDLAALSREEIILSHPCIEAIAIQRLAHRLYQSEVPVIPRMMTEWAHARTGIDIHPGAQIGSHFFIDHGTGVVIGETCRIGNHVKLYHGVTLGARSLAKDEEGRIVKGGKRHPEVCDNVTIYPNSTILGGETVIGENSTIGANVFLMQSVPPNSLVIQQPTQVRFCRHVLGQPRRARRRIAAEEELAVGTVEQAGLHQVLPLIVSREGQSCAPLGHL
ncbi:MAG TPA: serine O-acetyltransferase EpsC [Candidatus Methylacidiphilales bacterium]|jgi:serine O-acetyltransferase|nr:serine O-acetyltransferase EpsC [Candidatus Methylacidiphilales bacterium]